MKNEMQDRESGDNCVGHNLDDAKQGLAYRDVINDQILSNHGPAE